MARNVQELNEFENSIEEIMSGFSKEQLGTLSDMLSEIIDKNPTLKSKYNLFLDEHTCDIKCTRKDVDIIWEPLTNTEKKSVIVNTIVKLLENMSTDEVTEILAMVLTQLDLSI